MQIIVTSAFKIVKHVNAFNDLCSLKFARNKTLATLNGHKFSSKTFYRVEKDSISADENLFHPPSSLRGPL